MLWKKDTISILNYSPRETQDYAKIMHLFYMEYIPQTFNSTDQTNNYHSDDLAGYGETFSWINAQVHVKHFGKVCISESTRLFAKLTLYYNVLKTTESETKI